MNPFLLPAKERLLSWRELRNQISTVEDTEKFNLIAAWWARAPICAYSIDSLDCTQWPTPWELMNENMFCTSGVAYMMAQTLVLSGFDRSRIRLQVIRGNDDERLVVLVDNAQVLNYSFAEVFNWNEIQSSFQILASYEFKGEYIVSC